MRLIFEHQTKEILLFGELSDLDMECLDKVLDLFPEYTLVKGQEQKEKSMDFSNPWIHRLPFPNLPDPYNPLYPPWIVTCGGTGDYHITHFPTVSNNIQC